MAPDAQRDYLFLPSSLVSVMPDESLDEESDEITNVSWPAH
jgi:hypothetical protein